MDHPKQLYSMALFFGYHCCKLDGLVGLEKKKKDFMRGDVLGITIKVSSES